MPKVNYTAAKGLYQDSGSGFSVAGVAIQPSVKSLGRQIVTVAALDDTTNGGELGNGTGADVNGLYFSVYDHTNKVTVWFTSSDNTSPATVPSVEGTDIYVQVTVADADVIAANAAAAEVAIEAACSALEVNDGAGDGSFIIEGATPYEAAGTADNGNMDGTVTQTAAGAGDERTFALEPHGVSVLDLSSLASLEAATAFTLASGAHVGAFKVITRDDTENTDNTLTCTGFLANDTTLAARTFTFGGDTDTDSRTLVLCWDGNGWVIVKMGAGVSVA